MNSREKGADGSLIRHALGVRESPISLSKFIDAHSAELESSPTAAAFSLRDLFRRLEEYSADDCRELDQAVCWAAGVRNPTRRDESRRISYAALIDYFQRKALANGKAVEFLACQTPARGGAEMISDSAVYFSPKRLTRLIEDARAERLGFLFQRHWDKDVETTAPKKNIQRDALEKREIDSVKLILNSVFEMIHAVSKGDSVVRRKAARFDLAASAGLKAKALLELAEATGIELKADRKTIAKYFPREDELEGE
jgi:hypothetical protein